MISAVRKLIMSEWSRQALLSTTSKEQCIANLKNFNFSAFQDQPAKQTAAVLVPLCLVNDEVSLLYTLRSSNLKSHSGQVSFPGGKTDQGENAIITALREYEEELGLPRNEVDIWTEMSPVRGLNKDMEITPVVGFVENFDVTKLNPNTHEVEEVFTVTIKDLCCPSKHAHLEWENTFLPIFLHDKFKIWGITGFITHVFLLGFVPTLFSKSDFMRKKYTMAELMPSKL